MTKNKSLIPGSPKKQPVSANISARLERKVARIDRHIASLEESSRRYSWYRGLTLLFLGILGMISRSQSSLAANLELTAGVLIFLFLVIQHKRIESWLHRFRNWRQIKAGYLARIKLDWSNIPIPSVGESNRSSLEIDLNLTGNNSLHQLIDITVSEDGSRKLAAWLTQEIPDPNFTRWAQGIVQELAPMHHFRDRLLLHYQLMGGQRLRGSVFLSWFEKAYPDRAVSRLLPISGVMVAFNWLLIILNLTNILPAYWIGAVTLYLIFLLSSGGALQPFLTATVELDTQLLPYKTLLQYIQSYPFRNVPNLAKLCSMFTASNRLPGRELGRLRWLTAAIGLRTNPVMMLLLNTIFPWDFLFAWLAKRNRERLRSIVPAWMEALTKLDALTSLATFAYLHPGAVFPQFNHSEKVASPLTARELGHPLLHPSKRVNNDVTVENFGDLWLITGSNMAGKSTFIKTIGINHCLAYAGAPVIAKQFTTGFYRLHTCMQIRESLTDGFSYFYAEVQCLKRLLEKLQDEAPYPVLYLIDEIFRGTNNRERLIGSQAYIQGILGKLAFGFIATHDLELAKLAEDDSRVRNYHFRDQVLDHRLVFDYHLHSGPCPTSNALAIMKLEGLPVPPPGEN